MNINLNLEELVAIAARIELDGKNFYTQASKATSDPEAKELFRNLAEWEGTHYDTFNELLDNVTPQEFDHVIDPMNEAGLYLNAILGGNIFSQPIPPEDIAASNPKQIENIFRFALDREKDSIIFYSALEKIYINKDITSKLDIIIGEEISHIRFLHEIREKMLPGGK